MSNTTILITGGTGFAGSHLVEALLELGETNVHVTSFGGRTSYVSSLLPSQQIHQLDLTDQPAVNQLIQQLKPAQIYHLASTPTVGDSFGAAQKILDDHLHLQFNLLEATRLYAPQARVLAIGSALEYDTSPTQPPQPHLIINETHPLGPVSPYAISKAIQSHLAYFYARTHHLDIILAKPFNHIGERQAPGSVVADFAKQIVEIERGDRSAILVGNLAAERDFTDVKDMVKAYILLMNQGKTAEVYNLGSGKGYSIQQILDWLKEFANVPVTVTIDPQKFRPLDIHSIIADNGKVATLGWQPTTDIKPTIQRILAWWRTQL